MEIQKDLDARLGSIEAELPKDEPERGVTFKLESPTQGIHVWKNPINKFTVTRVHYTADPGKRSKEWKDAARAGMAYTDWLREYEIVWSSFEGVPVYLDEWSREFHVSPEPLNYAEAIPIVRGWDFGLSAHGMACVYGQLLQSGRLFVYRELTGTGMGLERFVEEVSRYSHEWFPKCSRYYDIVDPAGFARNQLDERTCVSVLRNPPLRCRPVPGERGILQRRSSVVEFLKQNVRGLPKLIVDKSCTILIEGFDGGYHFASDTQGRLKDNPDKNEYSHPHDALQYLASRIQRLDMAQQHSNIQVQGPRYNFRPPIDAVPQSN